MIVRCCAAWRGRAERPGRSRLMGPLAAALLALCVVNGPLGCTTQRHEGPRIPDVPPPTAQAVESAYNARVAGLGRVWAWVVVRFQTRDRDGHEVDEQGEGHLQLVQPRNLYLTIGKLYEPAFELGSNDTRYWWIDIRNKSARIGAHDRATPTAVARAGLPVQPSDLPELLGITPLKIETPPRWSDDGRTVEVSVPGRWGGRVLRLDPLRLEPVEIELLDRDGGSLAVAKLTEYEGVIVGGDVSAVARMAARVFVDVPSTSTQVTLWIREPENRGARIKPRAFDFEALSREYGVKSLVPIDEPAAPIGRGAVD